MINVMIVDDSAVMRAVIQEALELSPDIHVIATAPDPIFALQKMNRQWPDVLILDIEMPRMDGITFLRQVMDLRPTPIIIFSSIAESGSSAAFQALHAGAVSILAKPKSGMDEFLRNDIVNAVREAANAKLQVNALRVPENVGRIQQEFFQEKKSFEKFSQEKMSADVILAALPAKKIISNSTDKIIAIGTSTGGTQALEFVLPQLPKNNCGLVIVQHMPAQFTRMFAERLNKICDLDVREAQDGDAVIAGRALIAPGGKHMVVKRKGIHYCVEIMDGPAVSRHKPSVDVLFRSVANCAGANALGIIMTGMGDDGARGLKEMRSAGAHTIAQDEKTCVVFGMPKEAIARDGVDTIASLSAIPPAIAAFG